MKIIRAKSGLDLTAEGAFPTAKEALKSQKRLNPETLGFYPGIKDPPCCKFKLAVRVWFTRTDGKVVSRKILQTVKDWGWGHEVFDGVSYGYIESFMKF